MQNKAFITAFLVVLGVLVDAQILLSRPTVQVNGLYHPVSVMPTDHVPSYALFTSHQKTESQPHAMTVATTSEAPAQLSPDEKLKRCHILMTEFTLLLNKLIAATSLADRQVILERIHQIVVEIQSLETKFMDKKLDERLILIFVPADFSKGLENVKKEQTPSSSVKIVNPFEKSHSFNMGDMLDIALKIKDMVANSKQPTPAVNVNPSTEAKTEPQKPTIAGNPFSQPTVLTAAVQQPAVVASTVAQPARIVYPVGSPSVLPTYTLASPIQSHHVSYHPVMGSYIASRSGQVHASPYPNRVILYQENPLFAKSLAALKK